MRWLIFICKIFFHTFDKASSDARHTAIRQARLWSDFTSVVPLILLVDHGVLAEASSVQREASSRACWCWNRERRVARKIDNMKKMEVCGVFCVKEKPMGWGSLVENYHYSWRGWQRKQNMVEIKTEKWLVVCCFLSHSTSMTVSECLTSAVSIHVGGDNIS